MSILDVSKPTKVNVPCKDVVIAQLYVTASSPLGQQEIMPFGRKLQDVLHDAAQLLQQNRGE